jgi:hypothetical protein
LVGAKILVAKVGELKGVTRGAQKAHQFLELAFVGSDRVRAAVRFQLKPANVFVRGGLQIDCHVEAEVMLSQTLFQSRRVT